MSNPTSSSSLSLNTTPLSAASRPLRTQKSSNLTDQLQKEREIAAQNAGGSKESTARTPTKNRSISDAAPSLLLSSPKFLEASKGAAKDDISILRAPSTPSRPPLISRGLSLQMPNNDSDSQTFARASPRTPLSPKLDSINTYGATASVIPRRSRGLDFSRACTNLHHSTLADQSSPDSSPIMTGRGVLIPTRKGISSLSNSLGSPGSNGALSWSHMTTSERIPPIASSMGSVTMVDSDSNCSSSSDDDLLQDEVDDPILTTPQVYKSTSGISAFQPPNSHLTGASPGGDWLGNYSPAAASLMSFRRARIRKGRSRKSSSSASMSGGSSLASPTPGSPPVGKGVESNVGYFAKELAKTRAESRRSSLSWGTRELQISSGGESDDGNLARGSNGSGEGLMIQQQEGTKADERRTVVRPVSRRGNLMPKPKTFARIHAALMEEIAPVDTEVRREAEVVRQVRESDGNLEASHQPGEATKQKGSPTLLPTAVGPQDSLERDLDAQTNMGQNIFNNRRSGSFGLSNTTKPNSKEFWESFKRLKTPPPPVFSEPNSFTFGDDVNMDLNITPSGTPNRRPPPLHLHTESHQMALPTSSEMTQRINNKRRRDDDFDISSFKRRAVSPSMSVQNSPILQQSPAQKDGSWLAKSSREYASNNTSTTGPERGNSGSSTTSTTTGPKRIGMQGMVDTNDAIMKMSIE